MTVKNSTMNDDDFRFIKLPRGFWNEEAYSKLMPEDMVLYSLMRDRMELSKMNGWVDKNGSVYIIFTVSEIMEKLRCGKEKAGRHKKRLKDAGLISYRRGRRGDPDRIHVLPLIMSESADDIKSDFQTSTGPKISPDMVGKSATNKTDNIKTENNKNYPSGIERTKSTHEAVKEIIKESMEYTLLSERGYDMDTIDSYIEIMVSACCSGSETVKIGNEMVPRDLVRSRFEKYTFEDIKYAMECMEQNTTAIRNIRAYTLKTLYDAPITRILFYRAKVQHDMPGLVNKGSNGGGAY